jgi:hypothetical protein
MNITFEHDKDVIVYALEKVISYARKTQQIFVAQCVWWLALIIGLEQGLNTYIDIKQARLQIAVILQDSLIKATTASWETSEGRQDKVLREFEEYLRHSRRLRDIAKLKAIGIKRGKCIKTSKATGQLKSKKQSTKDFAKTEEIEKEEITRRKSAGEYLHCTWPSDRKGTHRVKDCIRPIKSDK